MITLCALALGVSLTACGDENTTEVTEKTGMPVLQAGESMPKCDDESEGQMVYATDSAAAFICADGKWQVLNSEGAKGADGADGANRKNGKAGTNGNDGNDGTFCTVAALPDSSGYKVLCGGDSVGVVLNGQDGSNGKGGTSCSQTDNGDGTVLVSCGSDDGATSTTLYKAICGIKPYDPSTHFCLSDEIYELCGTETYDPTTHFCQSATIYELCGTETYDPTTHFCQSATIYELCGTETYDPTTHFCLSDEIYELDLCGSNSYDPSTHLCDKRDAKVYRFVTIGEQAWMAENLNYDPGQGGSGDEKYDWSWCHENNEENCVEYGRLYTWAATIDSVKLATDATTPLDCGYDKECGLTSTGSAPLVQGVCPEGWRLPTKTEWEALITAVDEISTAGKFLKSESGWSGDGNGTDAFEFSALPAGYYSGGYFWGGEANFWSSTEYDSDDAYRMHLDNSDKVSLGRAYKNLGFSVRCLRD